VAWIDFGARHQLDWNGLLVAMPPTAHGGFFYVDESQSFRVLGCDSQYVNTRREMRVNNFSTMDNCFFSVVFFIQLGKHHNYLRI